MSNILFAQLPLLALPLKSSSTLDPAHCTAATLTFSNGNLTVTNTGGSDRAAVRSTSDQTAGKLYMEFTDTLGLSAQGAMACGILNSNFAFNGSEYLGDSNGNSIGWQNGSIAADNGNVGYNGSSIGTANPSGNGYTTGDVLAMAIDLGAKTVWFKNITQASNWNNNGSADPGSGVDGINISALSQPWFVGVEAYASSNAWTVNFGSSSFTGSIPSGFSAWG